MFGCLGVWIQIMLVGIYLFIFFAVNDGKKYRKYDLGTIKEGNDGGGIHAYMFFGEVSAGQFSYFEMKSEGRYRLILQSLTGDADIYLSFSKVYYAFYPFWYC